MENKKEKKGFSRLLELAGRKKKKLQAACTLSVFSSAAKLVPYFTIYGIIVTLLASYGNVSGIDKKRIIMFTMITLGAALVYW